MAKKAKGFVGVLADAANEILESAASIVDGSVFGEEEESNGTHGKSRKQANSESDESGESEVGAGDPKPAKRKASKPDLSTFKPTGTAKEKGTATGESESSEGTGDSTNEETS